MALDPYPFDTAPCVFPLPARFLPDRPHKTVESYMDAFNSAPPTILECRAHPETLRRRVTQRSAQGIDASEADLTVLHGQLAALEPLTAHEQVSVLAIDTDAPQAAPRLLEAVRALGEEP